VGQARAGPTDRITAIYLILLSLQKLTLFRAHESPESVQTLVLGGRFSAKLSPGVSQFTGAETGALQAILASHCKCKG